MSWNLSYELFNGKIPELGANTGTTIGPHMQPGDSETILVSRCRLGRGGNKDDEAAWD